jgi:hypothetical protein
VMRQARNDDASETGHAPRWRGLTVTSIECTVTAI